MVDVLSDSVLSVAQAARLLPPARSGKRCHVSTVLRWIVSGVRGPDGQMIRLEACRLGDRWLTSREAIARFVARLTPALDDTQERPAPPRTPTQRERSSRRAAKTLEAIGI